MRVAVTSDGSRIVTGSDDTTAQGVGRQDWRRSLLELKGHEGIVRSVAVTRDGSRIITGSDDKTARVWDAKTGAELLQAQWPHRRRLWRRRDARWRRIVTGAWDKSPARVWDAKTGNELFELKGHSADVNAVAVIIGWDAHCHGLRRHRRRGYGTPRLVPSFFSSRVTRGHLQRGILA